MYVAKQFAVLRTMLKQSENGSEKADNSCTYEHPQCSVLNDVHGDLPSPPLLSTALRCRDRNSKPIHQAANALECDDDSGEIASRVVPAIGCAGLTHDRDAGFRGDIVRTPAHPVRARSRDRTVPRPAQDAAGSQMYVTLSEIHDLPLPVSSPHHTHFRTISQTPTSGQLVAHLSVGKPETHPTSPFSLFARPCELVHRHPTTPSMWLQLSVI